MDESAERLPKPNYHSLKEKKIREMLNEYGVPSLGAKGQLVARHTQYVLLYIFFLVWYSRLSHSLRFVILYNSNLDRPISTRKTLGELRKELKAWEDSLTVKKTLIDDNSAYLVRFVFFFKWMTADLFFLSLHRNRKILSSGNGSKKRELATHETRQSSARILHPQIRRK